MAVVSPICRFHHESSIIMKTRTSSRRFSPFLLPALLSVITACTGAQAPVAAEPYVVHWGTFNPRISLGRHPDSSLYAVVQFRITAQGRATDIELLRSSSIRGLDIAALRSVKETLLDVDKLPPNPHFQLTYRLGDIYSNEPPVDSSGRGHDSGR